MNLRYLVVGLACLAASCSSASPSTDGTSTPESTRPISSTTAPPAPTVATWSEPEMIVPGLSLDPLGPVDTGVLTVLEYLPGTEAGARDPELRVIATSCQRVAPARWIIEGTATVPGDEPLSGVIDVNFLLEDEDSSHSVRATFSETGGFALPYNRLAHPNLRLESGGSWLEAEATLTGCRLEDGASTGDYLTIRHFSELPGWQAQQGSVQHYAQGASTTEDPDLRDRLGGDVWLGVTYPFDEIWLPDDPTGFGSLTVSNQPFCSSIHYTRFDAVVSTADISHLDGACHGVPPLIGPVDQADGWDWIDVPEYGGVVAQRSLSDGRLEIRASDEAAVIDTINQLHPYKNLLSSRPAGPVSAENAANDYLTTYVTDGDPAYVPSERSRFPTEGGTVIVFTGIRPRDCEGCDDVPEWYALATTERTNGWEASFVGGGEWDECLAISYNSSPGSGSDTVAIAGDPDWVLEEGVDGAWNRLPSIEGVWAELAEPFSGLEYPVIRAVNQDGVPQACSG